jgi:hypothetical protein
MSSADHDLLLASSALETKVCLFRHQPMRVFAALDLNY